MKCWYFFFEGELSEDPETGKPSKLYSSALVPCAERKPARHLLISSLSEYGVELINIEDDFLYDPDDVDPENGDNDMWISWHQEVKRFNETIFTPWYLFDD